LTVTVWRWARHVVTDRGEGTPVPIFLERIGHDGGYRFRLGVRAGFGGQETARIEVHRRLNPDPHPVLKEIFSCEVAGRTLQAANVFALQAKVAALLDSIAPARTLPLCYFRAAAMDYELPVYEHEGRISSPIIGGPRLRATDLAGIRRHICRYLVSAGYVHEPEDVQVLVLRPRDLRLVPPAAVFRSSADPEVWIPCVDGISAEGPVVGVLEHAAHLRYPRRARFGSGLAAGEASPAAPEIVSLLRYMRLELAGEGRALDPATLYAAEVRPDQWALAEARLSETGARLVAYLADDQGTRLETAIRRTGAGESTTAIEDRGISVFAADSDEELAGAVGRYLAAQGFLRFAEEIEVHPAEMPRAERLDVDTIWTRGDDFGVIANDSEEAHA
jgi:hypothetical protein